MASPPPSLASVLAIPGVDAHSHPGGDGVANDDESSAAVLSYLHETYPNNETDLSLPSLRPNSRSQNQTQNHSQNQSQNANQFANSPYPPNRRSASPSDPSIRVDPALQALADATAASTPLDIPAPFTSYPPMLDNYGALGEMGGKRKKLPHERAGWREMDEEGPRKRRGKRNGNDGGRSEGGKSEGPGDDPQYGVFVQGGNNSSASPGNLDAAVVVGDQQQGNTDLNDQPPPPPPSGQGSKDSRSEQNRRAQQAFRRRREERMKDLEAAAAALEPTQRRLQDAESKLREAVLALEASRIEASALRSALLNVALASGYSVLTNEGTIAINSSVATTSQRNTEREIDQALDTLSQHSRELAKQNRDRRS